MEDRRRNRGLAIASQIIAFTSGGSGAIAASLDTYSSRFVMMMALCAMLPLVTIERLGRARDNAPPAVIAYGQHQKLWLLY